MTEDRLKDHDARIARLRPKPKTRAQKREERQERLRRERESRG